MKRVKGPGAKMTMHRCRGFDAREGTHLECPSRDSPLSFPVLGSQCLICTAKATGLESGWYCRRHNGKCRARSWTISLERNHSLGRRAKTLTEFIMTNKAGAPEAIASVDGARIARGCRPKEVWISVGKKLGKPTEVTTASSDVSICSVIIPSLTSGRHLEESST